ncbi:MAG: hypothetical protein K2X74_23170 [Acetobacteraceae bacterium]|nr:hypothetical protein [Acetobacteraceae bacterium]
MSSTTTAKATLRDRLADRWDRVKPVALGVVGGLIAGPILTGMLGFQTRTSTAEAAMRASVVEQQAMFCNERARATLPAGTARLDWNRGYDLAKQWAAMPGAAAGAAFDPDVQQACARRLSS